MARDVFDVHIAGVVGITDGDIMDVKVTELLGDGAAMAPVGGTLVVVEHGDSSGGIREF